MTEVRLPGSKSVTARALFLAAAASRPDRAARAAARRRHRRAFAGGLTALGYAVAADDDALARSPAARPGPPAGGGAVCCHDAATASRFLPALCAAGHGTYRFDASAQMRAAADRAAASARCASWAWTSPPRTARAICRCTVARRRHQGRRRRRWTPACPASSSPRCCLLGPLTAEGLRIRVTDLVSAPYVEITLAMMRPLRRRGAARDGDDSSPSRRPATRPRTTTVEPDASTASYFLAAAALTGSTVTVPGLGAGRAQGDLRFGTQVLARDGRAR